MVGKPLKKTKVPKDFQPILWSADVNDLDIDKHKGYIIHQIFAYGRMKEILWLFHTYSKETLKRVFSTVPYKDYFPARFHFVKNYLLGLTKLVLNERRYVRNTPRDLG